MDVGGTPARLQDARYGALNALGRFRLTERIAQHHGRGKNGRERIGDALARDIGRGAVDRLVEALAALIERGIPASRLAAVGRKDNQDLSRTVGETSPNRRVQFEVGFEGEGAE